MVIKFHEQYSDEMLRDSTLVYSSELYKTIYLKVPNLSGSSLWKLTQCTFRILQDVEI